MLRCLRISKRGLYRFCDNSDMPSQQPFHHYLPISNAAIQWGLYITGAGQTTILPGQSYPPAGHPGPYDFRWQSGRTLPEFQILLVTQGQGQFETSETGPIPVTDGSLLFLFPSVWHRYQPDPQTGWTERWLSFNGELAHRFMDRGPIQPASAVRAPRDPQHVATAFDRLLTSIHTNPGQDSMLLSLHAMSLLATAIEAAAWDDLDQSATTTDPGERRDPLVAQAVDYIWTRSHYPITVPRIAQEMQVNRRTLERRFAAERGHSILAEINACRLSRAKRLLEETNLPLKVVTHLAGFTSEQRMRAIFLDREEMLPSQFRRTARKPLASEG